mmetsp:Transcript_17031/g.30505  ORF Transcript_17031/g.30505 Transcript_17031/m.30505 type:complete len:408 (+) Transcript_17031:198-1421(+)
MEKCAKDAKERGRESWKYAYALDTTEGERNKGKTEECGSAYFETNKTRFTILDAPGHKGYVPNMINGATQADVAILVISGRKGEFETGFDRGGQTREHAILSKTAGVKKMLVCVNKLDDPSVVLEGGKWSNQRFEEIKAKLVPYLKQIGWKSKDVEFMPISGLLGEGLLNRLSPQVCNWYTGPSLVEALDDIAIPNDHLHMGPILMPISYIYKDRDLIVSGKLESGIVRIGDKLDIFPVGKLVKVTSLHCAGGDETNAYAGENLKLGINGVDENDVHPGAVIGSPEANLRSVVKIEAVLFIIEARNLITQGYSAVMHIHEAQVPCTIYKLTGELHRKTGQLIRRHPKFAKTGMRVRAKIALELPTVVQPFKTMPKLGRFMLRAEGKTVAVGMVQRVAKMTSRDKMAM